MGIKPHIPLSLLHPRTRIPLTGAPFLLFLFVIPASPPVIPA